MNEDKIMNITDIENMDINEESLPEAVSAQFQAISEIDKRIQEAERNCATAKEIADKMVKKMTGLRIFEDENGKTNLSLADVNRELLLISQFTLYANCKKGNRPSFTEAGEPHRAEELYEYMVAKAREQVPVVETGVFGAEMEVSLVNDGPFTVILEDL